MGGYSERGRIPPLEIIDLINTKLKSDIMMCENGSRESATGAILQNKPLCFGGHINDDDSTIVFVIFH